LLPSLEVVKFRSTTESNSLQAIIKIDNPPKELEEVPHRSRKQKKFRNEDLPNGSQECGRWRKNFVTTLFWYVAYQPDPWNLDDNDTVIAMQQIWDSLYGKAVPYNVTVHDAVFTIVGALLLYSQRCSYLPSTSAGFLGLTTCKRFMAQHYWIIGSHHPEYILRFEQGICNR
jgi:hypothetical protein